MGVRGELFSTKVSLQNRTYFFNVKENRLGDLYLNIVESKNRDEGGFDRQSVILFAEDLQEFLQGFDESLKVLEKAVREKRRGTPNKREFPGEKPNAFKSDSSFKSRSGSPPRFEDRHQDGQRFENRPRFEGKPRFEDRPRFQDRPRAKGPKAHGQGRKDYGEGRSSYRSRQSERPTARSTDHRPRGNGDFNPRKKRVVIKKH